MRRFYLLAFLYVGTWCIPNRCDAQVGGESTFDFLTVPGTARVTGTGGVNVSSGEGDVNMFLYNPALLTPEAAGYISANYVPYLAGIQYATLAYAHAFDSTSVWAMGLQYMGYGNFEGYDQTGAAAGEFGVSEFAITLGRSHTLGNFTLGVNLKLAAADIASYAATALLMDIGGRFRHPDKDVSIGLTLKNIGVLLGDFTPESESSLPFDVQLGATFKPEHMPFRFSVTAYNLSKGDIGYFDPAGGLGSNKEEPGTVDKIFRHLVFGMEILLNDNVNLRAGYNHLIRKELRLEQVSGGAGFSLGFMVKVKAFELAYSHAFYHVGGGANSITLSSHLGSLFKEKEL